MDFALSPRQREWYEASVNFAKESLQDDILDRDERRVFWREGWRRCGEFGIQGLPVPTEYGGKGEGLGVTIAAMEGLGFGCPDNALVFAMNASMWTNTIPILRYGTEEQKRKWLPDLASGKLVGANGASEPEAGSDIFSMRATAARDESTGEWVLNGHKTWITSGPVADVFVCYATTDPSKGVLGISAFIVPKGAPGFRVLRELYKLGMRTIPMGEAKMEDCRVPADALLGREGRGAEVFNCSMEWERGAILAATLGTMRRQLQTCVKFARSRKQYGQALIKFQAVSHRLAEMRVRLETCRAMVYRIGWLKDKERDATLEAAMAKLHVSEAFVANSLDAVRLFGARGFVSEYGIEKDLRDSVGSLIFSGTNDVMKSVIANHPRLLTSMNVE